MIFDGWITNCFMFSGSCSSSVIKQWETGTDTMLWFFRRWSYRYIYKWGKYTYERDLHMSMLLT